MRAALDACGCFPTGRHYAGIAHLLRTLTRGLLEEHPADAPWAELPIALVDVETTGKDASVDRVVEVGIALSRGGQIVDRKNWLVNPGIPIPKEASDIHKITDEHVRDAPRFEAIAVEVTAALAGCIPGAYNVTNAEGPQSASTQSLYTATTNSVNVFYAELEKKVGLCNVVHTAANLGRLFGSQLGRSVVSGLVRASLQTDQLELELLVLELDPRLVVADRAA